MAFNPMRTGLVVFLCIVTVPLAIFACITTAFAFAVLFFRVSLVYLDLALQWLPVYLSIRRLRLSSIFPFTLLRAVLRVFDLSSPTSTSSSPTSSTAEPPSPVSPADPPAMSAIDASIKSALHASHSHPHLHSHMQHSPAAATQSPLSGSRHGSRHGSISLTTAPVPPQIAEEDEPVTPTSTTGCDPAGDSDGVVLRYQPERRHSRLHRTFSWASHPQLQREGTAAISASAWPPRSDTTRATGRPSSSSSATRGAAFMGFSEGRDRGMDPAAGYNSAWTSPRSSRGSPSGSVGGNGHVRDGYFDGRRAVGLEALAQ